MWHIAEGDFAFTEKILTDQSLALCHFQGFAQDKADDLQCLLRQILFVFALVQETLNMYATFNELMKNSWRMKEIDEMDMPGFLCLRAWDATREQEKKKPRQRFIDEVWPGVKPG